MGKKKVLIIIPILVTAMSLFACKKEDNEPVISFEKTVIEQTYHDLIANSDVKYSGIPTTGSPKLLVIPVWFTDSNNFITAEHKNSVREDINTAYFGNATDTGWNSVTSFYNQESSGKVTLTGTTSEWYECGKSYTYYATDKNAIANFAVTASNWFFTNHPNENRKDYDLDEDGYLDGVILIYAAPDNESLKKSYQYPALWAFTSWSGLTANKEAPVSNACSWISYDFMYGNNATSRAGTAYNAGDTTYLTIDSHIMIHETGHLFGLYDYYDYDTTKIGDQWVSMAYAGGFSMQDYNVGGHDAYSVMSLGWADPFIPDKSGEITLKSFQATHQLILLTPEWNDYNSPFDEYLLLELYTAEGLNNFDTVHYYKYNAEKQTSYPFGPTQAGIRLWHVDSRLLNTSDQITTNAKGNKKVRMGANNNRASGKNADFKAFHLLQLIRCDTSETKETRSMLSNNNLFKQGNGFTIESFNNQFNGNGLLDNLQKLNWTFYVKKIFTDSDGIITAKISLSKLS